ncbi:hypothetical protein R3P38DRAFT_2773930 [Favolaschia claudopus]|uniref:Uncharacterized protein n=1 Tax=Favolaschia claudopus TaxID=2862362 RepID=A0AAW0BYI7_9AGAR
MSRQPSVEAIIEPRETRPSPPLHVSDCIMRPVEDDSASIPHSPHVDSSPSESVTRKRGPDDLPTGSIRPSKRSHDDIGPSTVRPDLPPSATAFADRRARENEGPF